MPGLAKTRLCPPATPEEAADVAAAELRAVLRRITVLPQRGGSFADRSANAHADTHRTASAAGVFTVDDDWRLTVGARRFSRRELEALPQTTAELPIACVEGWSASARWTGVPVRDLPAPAGVEPGDVRVESLERDGLYRASTLPAAHARDPLTPLALRVDGETLPLDHGYPCLLIAPSRPGVTQTKWVTRLEVIRVAGLLVAVAVVWLVIGVAALISTARGRTPTGDCRHAASTTGSGHVSRGSRWPVDLDDRPRRASGPRRAGCRASPRPCGPRRWSAAPSHPARGTGRRPPGRRRCRWAGRRTW